MIIQHHYPLLSHNTFQVNAFAKTFIEYSSLEELQQILPTLSAPYLHIGEGSNLLFTKDYQGTILHSAIVGKHIKTETDSEVTLEIGAGENFDNLVAWCVEKGFYGIENLSQIPGEVGAAAVQNIGAYGTEIGDYIQCVKLCKINGETLTLTHEEMKYAYRFSILKTESFQDCFVTSVILKLSKIFTPQLSYHALKDQVEKENIATDAASIRNLVIRIRQSKLPKVGEIGSAGSFFMNPIISEEAFKQLQLSYPNLPHYVMPQGKIKIPAGWLIDQAGWKGKQKGNVAVYPKQALVIVNVGGATGAEIADFSHEIAEDIEKKFNIKLQSEVRFI